MAEPVLRLRVAGQSDIQSALQALGSQAQVVSEKTNQLSQAASGQLTPAIRGSHLAMVEFGRAMAGAAAVSSIFARNNPELQRQLEVLSLTLSGLGTSARALGAALILLANN